MKRVIALALACLMMISSFNFVAAENDYSSHWASKEIQYLMDKGIVKGYEDGSFKPEKTITRAEFVTMINAVIVTEGKSENLKFKDVPEDAWYYDEVSKGVKEGYVVGISDEIFGPNNKVTREQAATFIGRALKLEELDDASIIFSDGDKIQTYAVGYVNAAVEAMLK